MRKFFHIVVLLAVLTTVFKASVSANDYPPGVCMGGGINTVEGWYDMNPRDPLVVLTGYEYDIVATAYGEPGVHVSMNIMGPSANEIPWVSKGTFTFLEFSEAQNEWIIGVDADETGTAEVVIHMPWPVSPDFIRVSIYPVGKNWDFWYAKVSTHQVFLPLVLKQ